MQHVAPERMRATIGCILCGGAALSLAMLSVAGRFGAAEVQLGVALSPFLLAGFALSNRLRGGGRRWRCGACCSRCARRALGVLAKLAWPG